MKRTIAVVVLFVSLCLGVIADVIVRDVASGLGMFLWICGVACAVWVLQHLARVELAQGWKWMTAAAIVMAGAFLWRDSDAVQAYAFLAAAGAGILTTLRGNQTRLEALGMLECGHAAVASVFHAAIGLPMLVFSDIRWEEMKAGRASRMVDVVRGLAIAGPVILVIGALFVGADAVFKSLVYEVFDIDLAWIMKHIFFTGFITWGIAGFLRGTFIAKPAPFPYAERKIFSLGMTEVGIVLGSSILLFGLFIAVQFRYLFGGADLVLVTPSMTYADYARRGFFELTTVVAIVLPLLLALDWLLRKENPAHVRIFRILTATQIVLLFAVIASALQRMLLYQQEYGLTESRIYTVAFMGWMALVLVWYGLTVLAGRRSRFAIGAVGGAFITVLILLVLNPDDLIARTNIQRANEGKSIDTRYLSQLSDDAVPALMEGLPTLDRESRIAVAHNLLQRKQRLEARDWRSWNWSSHAALQTLSAHEEQLRATAHSSTSGR